jgi:signal peptidase I
VGDREQAPRSSGLTRFAGWLFERRPDRRAVGAHAPSAQPTEPAPSAQPAAEPAPSAQPAAEPAASAQPDPGGEPPAPDGVANRPRPYTGWEKVDRKPTRTRRSRRVRDTPPSSTAAEQSDDGSAAPRRRTGSGAGRRLLRLLVTVVIIVAAAVALRSYVVSPYYVPSGSMEPTLHGCSGCNDDHVLVEKLSYRFHDVQRGDVVVFHRPATWHLPDKVLIKRVVAVGGDHLVIRGGHVYVNRQLIDEPYVNPACSSGTTGRPGVPDRRARRFPTVPHGAVFVMGDNRCESDDSRVFGVVPTSTIIGRAFMIVWPLKRWHAL